MIRSGFILTALFSIPAISFAKFEEFNNSARAKKDIGIMAKGKWLSQGIKNE